MTGQRHPWTGVDVGGRRKGFHLAGIDPTLKIHLEAFRGDEAVSRLVDRIASWAPRCVAIDAPATWAERGGSRACEQEFTRAGICGIRYTPTEETATARTDGYYEWILLGSELWEEVRRRGLLAIECFPTASWTRGVGEPGSQTRAAWTRRALDRLCRRGLRGCERVSNQDQRDAVAAALTARQYDLWPEVMEAFGPLMVPERDTEPLLRGL